MNAQRKKRMFTNILQKLKLFANWRPWPEKLELMDGLVQDRFTLLDAIQTSFRADGVLTSGRIDELNKKLAEEKNGFIKKKLEDRSPKLIKLYVYLIF